MSHYYESYGYNVYLLDATFVVLDSHLWSSSEVGAASVRAVRADWLWWSHWRVWSRRWMSRHCLLACLLWLLLLDTDSCNSSSSWWSLSCTSRGWKLLEGSCTDTVIGVSFWQFCGSWSNVLGWMLEKIKSESWISIAIKALALDTGQWARRQVR